MKKHQIFIILTLSLIFFCQTGFSQSQPPVPDTIINGKHFRPAAFPGGIDGWRLYLQKNLRYPKKALRQNLQGTAKIELTVDDNGKVTKTSIVTDPGGGLGEEARRVTKDGPDWIAATEDGRPTTYTFTQTITFRLQ